MWILAINYLFLPITASRQSNGLCPYSWSSFEVSCYKLLEELTTWDEAKRRCEEASATLVTISSEEENDFVKNLGGYCERTWIGLNDIDVENDWKWLSNESFTFSDWITGQPDNRYSNEDCGELRQCTTYNRKWDDKRCIVANPAYVCEKGLCPSTWSSFEGSCYKLLEELTTWHEAKVRCEEANAALVTISSEDENDFVRNLGGYCERTWIGLNDIDVENDWKWLSNEPFNFSDWNTGQPDNRYNNEDCGELRQCTNDNRKWDDKRCLFANPAYVCEKVPEFHSYTARLVTATASKKKCLTAETLAVFSLGRRLISSRTRCFQFCISTTDCTTFLILQMADGTVCHALKNLQEDAQYELEPLNCGLFVWV